MTGKPTYRDLIYILVKQIPHGKVVSYGQIARLVPHCTARMVGYAMASCPEDVPWQRVINSQGKISPRGVGWGAELQHQILEAEGVQFDLENRVDFNVFGWQPK